MWHSRSTRNGHNAAGARESRMCPCVQSDHEAERRGHLRRPPITEAGLERLLHHQPSLPMCVCISVHVHDGFEITATNHLSLEQDFCSFDECALLFS
jgi:hypothetical protein